MPALAHEVDVGSSAPPIGGVVICGLHLELLNRVRCRNSHAHLFAVIGSRVLREIIRVDAVELDVVRGGLGAVGGNILRVRGPAP